MSIHFPQLIRRLRQGILAFLFCALFLLPSSAHALQTPNFFSSSSIRVATDANLFTLVSTETMPVSATLNATTKNISGKVTDNAGVPQPGIDVELYATLSDGSQSFRAFVSTDLNGNYQFSSLYREKYRLRFVGESKFFNEYYPRGDERIDLSGTNSPNSVVVNVDLDRSPIFSGTVVGSQGEPLKGISVSLYHWHPDGWKPIVTNPDGSEPDRSSGKWDIYVTHTTKADGTYRIVVGSLEEYRIHFGSNQTYTSEFYNNVTTLEAAQPFLATTDSVFANLDAQLTPNGVVTGTVSTTEGQPLADVTVQGWPVDGRWGNYDFIVKTNAAGQYSLSLLPGREFKLAFSRNGYDLEFYNDQATITNTVVFSAPIAAVIPDINAQLSASPFVVGTVTDDAGQPISGVEVRASRSVYYTGRRGNESAGSVMTDAQGRYSFQLRSGNYQFYFHDPSGRHISEYYQDAATHHEADWIVLAPGVDQTINAELLRIGTRISGRVVNSAGVALGGVTVSLLKDGVCCQATAGTNSANGGYYEFRNIPFGNYQVRAGHSSYMTEYYPTQRLLQNASVITLTSLSVVENVDFVLDKPGELVGFVVDKNNQPIPNIRVHFTQNLVNFEDSYTHTGWNGIFRIPIFNDLPMWMRFSSGSVDFRYTNEFYDNQFSVEAATPIIVPAETTVTVTIQLSDAPVISGSVTNLEGAALADVTVTPYLYNANSTPPGWYVLDSRSITKTDSEGRYSIPHLWRLNEPYHIGFTLGNTTVFYPNATTVEEGQDVVITAPPGVADINVMMDATNQVDASFIGTPVSGSVPLTVTFTEQSRGPTSSRSWSFGDGTTSSEMNPTHTYSASGIYTATLSVTGSVNSAIEQKTSYITVTDAPIANLSIQDAPATGGVGHESMIGETRFFSATAVGSNVEYLWNFGDSGVEVNSVASGQYAQYTYHNAGTYTVTLTARNGASEQVATTVVTVVAAPQEEEPVEEPTEEPVEEPGDEDDSPIVGLAIHAPTSAFISQTLQFSATIVAGENVRYTWDFGDTTTGSGQVVDHTYSAPGLYMITLTASNNITSQQATMTMTVATVPDGEEPPREEPPSEEIPPSEEPPSEELPSEEPPNEEPPNEEPPNEEPPNEEPPNEELPPSEEEPSGEEEVPSEEVPPTTGEPVQTLALLAVEHSFVNFAVVLSATVAAGDPVSYTWDFGDGESGNGPVVYHTYRSSGMFTVVLTASNSLGHEQVTGEINVRHGILLPWTVRD